MVRRLRCQHADRVLAGRHLLMEEFVLDSSMTSDRLLSQSLKNSFFWHAYCLCTGSDKSHSFKQRVYNRK